MDEYFDGFLYYAVWGTHNLKLGIPASSIDLETMWLYSHDEDPWIRLSEKGDKVILDFLLEGRDGEWDECENDVCLSSFLSLRDDICRGDLRCLYLGWLSGLQYDECDEEELEPPVPPGLKNLNAALVYLVYFLKIDIDLIDAAASTSSSLSDIASSPQDLQAWLSTLSSGEKDDMLAEILTDTMRGGQGVTLRQVNRFQKTWKSSQGGTTTKRRTVSQILKEAEKSTKKRIQLKVEQAIELKKIQKVAQEKRLSEISGREDVLWGQIELLASEKKAKSYEKAIELLIDLRDLALWEKSTEFPLRLDALKKRHSSKSSFAARLRELAESH